MEVKIKKSTREGKKFMAIFFKDKKKIKTTHFGAAGMSDFTIHKQKERKQRYLDIMSAGALSRWILWNKPTLEASIKDYAKRFKLKIL